MSKTYEPIATQTVSSSTASVTFSSIPQTYTDLIIVAQIDPAASNYGLRFRINSDTASNYSGTVLAGTGSAASSTRYSNETSGPGGSNLNGGSNDYANIFILNFMSYTNTNIFKTVLSEGSSAGTEVTRAVSLWRSTSAINSITLSLGGGFPGTNIDAGIFTLYGVKAESPVLPLLTESTKTTSSVSAIISNYDAGLTYTVASTAGTATRSTNTVTVSGLTEGQNITLTVTATDGNNSSSSNTISLTSEPLPSGGTITTSGGYRIHTFTSTDSLIIPSSKTVEYLVVAGGGGSSRGGGGGGGMKTGSTTLSAQTYTVTIGSGGAALGGAGTGSSLGSVITTTGGGFGGGGTNSIPGTAGGNGGSGGGGGGSTSYSGTFGNGVSGEGNNGGYGELGSGAAASGGGGGGKGAVGGQGLGSIGGNGGNGQSSSISGAPIYYAGGGGGWGGSGSGGAGLGGGSTANIGGGGSGANQNGGSGVVIIRYPV